MTQRGDEFDETDETMATRHFQDVGCRTKAYMVKSALKALDSVGIVYKIPNKGFYFRNNWTLSQVDEALRRRCRQDDDDAVPSETDSAVDDDQRVSRDPPSHSNDVESDEEDISVVPLDDDPVQIGVKRSSPEKDVNSIAAHERRTRVKGANPQTASISNHRISSRLPPRMALLQRYDELMSPDGSPWAINRGDLPQVIQQSNKEALSLTESQPQRKEAKKEPTNRDDGENNFNFDFNAFGATLLRGVRKVVLNSENALRRDMHVLLETIASTRAEILVLREVIERSATNQTIHDLRAKIAHPVGGLDRRSHPSATQTRSTEKAHTLGSFNALLAAAQCLPPPHRNLP